jgi:hypothetical protein
MDSVNPVILLTAGTAVVGLLAAVSVCRKHSVSERDIAAHGGPAKAKSAPQQKQQHSQAAAPAPAAAPEQKPKKKSKSKAKKAGAGAGTGSTLLHDQLEDLDDEEDVPLNSTVPQPKIVVESKAPPPAPAVAGKSTAKAPSAAAKSSQTAVSPAAPSPQSTSDASPAAAAPAHTIAEAPVKQSKAQKKAASKAAAPAHEAPAAARREEHKAVPDFPVDDFGAGSLDSFSPAEYAGMGSDDGWNVVEDKRKQKALTKPKAPEKAAPAAASSSSSSAAAATETVPTEAPTTMQVAVDNKRVGVIIGPKGATLKQIQELTGVEIQTPKDKDSKAEVVNVTVTGPSTGVAVASRIINDLNTKGYSADLEGEDFNEAHMMIHPS